MRFKDKVVMISGAATGFGRVAAQRFAEEGARLSLCDIKPDTLAETAAMIDGDVITSTVNVSSEEDQQRWVAETVAKYGRIDIALNKMLADVPGADVVVVNPTHYAVALSWKRDQGEVPVCVAKGIDHAAARIREVASEAGVPIYSDPPTARALHATIEVGQGIAPDHYRAVAAAIRFADRMRRIARALT